MWEELPAGLANYVTRLLARQQLLRRIHCRQEEITRFGIVMRIYNPVSQQGEDEMDRRFSEDVNTLEIVPENSNVIERIIFGMVSRYLSQ